MTEITQGLDDKIVVELLHKPLEADIKVLKARVNKYAEEIQELQTELRLLRIYCVDLSKKVEEK